MARILFLGDIVGRPGRQAIIQSIAGLRERLAVQCVVANGENAASGAGITSTIYRQLMNAGIDAITLGDHCWDQRGFDREIDGLEMLCRPANLPSVCPGRDHLIVESGGFRLGVFTVLGRQFMKILAGDPFGCATGMIDRLKSSVDALLIEIHAETTSEKVAFGWYLDGRACGVVGTHTHIPTADCRVLPRGTAYITDVGMSGAYQSVLGRDVEPVVARFIDGMPRKFTVAEKDVRICGILIDVDASTGLATSVERIEVPIS